MKKSFLRSFSLIMVLSFSSVASGQLDTTFWFAAPEVSQTFSNNFDRPVVLRISTLNQPATIVVTVPANPFFTPSSITIPANSTQSIDLTSRIDLIESKPANSILSTGLKITSTNPVNIYYEVVSGLSSSCQCNPEIFVMKGKNALGKNFIVPSQNTQENGPYYTPSAQSSFDIVASESNTNVIITPRNAIIGHPAGISFSIVLNKGEVYSAAATSLLPNGHLGGSKVQSDKPVAVTVKDDLLNSAYCWDLGGDQIVPIDHLSNEYIAIRGFLNVGSNDMVYVTAVENNTNIYRDNVLIGTINASQTQAVPFINDAMQITSSSKIYAFQLSGFGCEIGLSSIPSNSCRGSTSVSFTRSSPQDLFLLITTKDANKNFFLLNGMPLPASSFNPVPGTNNVWVYARISISLLQVPALTSGVLTNSNGRFHMGIIHGAASGGARFAYFSDFASPSLIVLQDTLRFCGANTVLDAGPGYSNYNWNTGATTQTINVSQNGLYKIVVTNNDGCLLSDSGFVKLEPPFLDSSSSTICSGQTYTLPWGITVNASGIYKDTLHYPAGCDSLIRIVNLVIQPTALKDSIHAKICTGSSYTLPWGPVVNTTGIYKDTLRYTTGCDSIVRIVNLIVQDFTLQTTNEVICAGSSYTLPWGTTINTAGIYKDTHRYTSGCDSIVRIVNLTVQDFISQTTNAVICDGSSYTLPWGTVASTAGLYRDTLYYATGCDSIRRTVNLIVQTATSTTINDIICQGYTLPWGTVVNTAGIYSDTLFSTTGCDSVISIVNLQVSVAVSSLNATICSDETYALPWGLVTNKAGLYKDTLRTSTGCDSLIRLVNLNVNPIPSVKISKSNDVDCMIGTSKLEANGGVSYYWTPAVSLNNANIHNPIASPPVTTWYRVVVTSNKGCITEDSILVKVIIGGISNGYPVPNAFTPNNDGKNDCFGVQSWGAVRDFEFSIFNRWGERVFYTKDPRQCWDGTYKGVRQSANVFVYQVKAKGLCSDIYRKGTLVLIR